MVVRNFNERVKETVDVLKQLKAVNKDGLLQVKALIVESDDEEVEYYIMSLDKLIKSYEEYIGD